MGYRAHTVTQHREYGSSVFCDWQLFQDYLGYLREQYEDDMMDAYENEAEDYYQIPKIVIEQEVIRLAVLPPDEIEKHLDAENQYVLSDLRDALKEAIADDTDVTLEWF